MLLYDSLHILYHLPSIRLVNMISLLMALQRRTIESNTLRFQLREIKHHHFRYIDEGSEFRRPKCSEALWSPRALYPRFYLLGSLQQVLFDRSNHTRRARIINSCKDPLVCSWCELALAISHEGKGTFDRLPEADRVCDGVDDAEC